MNTRYIALILLKYWWCWNEFFIPSTAIPNVKFDTGSLNKNTAHARKNFLSNDHQRYPYLNYKETYGLRFEPKNIDKRQNKLSESNVKRSWNSVSAKDDVLVTTSEYADIAMVTNALGNDSSETTTIENPSSGNLSTAVNAYKLLSMEPNRLNKRHMLVSSALHYQIDALPQQNTTTTTAATTTMGSTTTAAASPKTISSHSQKSSALRDTLNLIRKRFKQWLTFGADEKPPLNNSQRFLSVFNVIKFENGPCASAEEGLAEMTGICYHDYQCEQMGGTAIDECADGLGVCCVFNAACGQTTAQSDLYFQNPGWPDASVDRLICTLTVELQEDVAQVRLDFTTFELKPPSDGNCVDDQFFVAGQNLNNQIPTLCGINSGQHMYIEVDNSLDRKLFLSILTTTAGIRAFNMRVTQLKDSLAPNNCLQYYTDVDGWLQTFNYDDTSQFVVNRIPSYFNNLNYVICIRRQWNYCSTVYSNEADGVEYEFQLLNIDSEGTSVIPEKQAGVEIFSCNDDYIAVNSIRLCGEKLNDASRSVDLTTNALITDTSNGLNIIPVRTSAAAVGRGFRINYIQMPCEDQPVTMEPATSETTEQAATEHNAPHSKYKRNRTL